MRLCRHHIAGGMAALAVFLLLHILPPAVAYFAATPAHAKANTVAVQTQQAHAVYRMHDYDVVEFLAFNKKAMCVIVRPHERTIKNVGITLSCFALADTLDVW